MAEKEIGGAMTDKIHSGISSRKMRRAAGKRKKAARMKKAQPGSVGGMGWPEEKDRASGLDDDGNPNSDPKKWMFPGG